MVMPKKHSGNLMEKAFDLNEIRVTTVAELADLLVGLPDPISCCVVTQTSSPECVRIDI